MPVLEEIQRDLVALPGVGMSILEISHRSKTFESILAQAEADIRTLGGIPSNYKVLFLQGGASTAVLDGADEPARRRARRPTTSTADRGPTRRSRKRRKVGTRQRRRDDEGRELRARCRAQAELKLTPGAAYVHMTSNNTIEGTEYKTLPDVGDAPLVSDTSSDMFSRPIDVARHALIYAGRAEEHGPGRRDGRHHPRRSRCSDPRRRRPRCRRC